MKKILWLVSWFPDKIEPLSGDFIERHATAVSLLNDITVIHVVKDHKGLTNQKTTIERKQLNPNLTVITGYYKSPIVRRIGGLLSTFRYYILQKKLIDEYIRERGRPDIVNVHISYKAGAGALYCRRRYGVKYIVSEQWTIFCPEARPGFNEQPFLAKLLIKKVYRNAFHSNAVSSYLSRSLSQRFGIKLPVRIPNVVDTDLFHPTTKNDTVFRFIHISVLKYQKSPHEIIEATRLLKAKTKKPFELVVYGPIFRDLVDLVKASGLDDTIFFKGEVLHPELSSQLRLCHALILYSRFETFGCVIIEAFASGIPVIVSDIPVMRELVTENVTGIFARLEDATQLAFQMEWMMENYNNFDLEIIRSEAFKYSFKTVAKSFDDLYTEVIEDGNSA